MGSDYTHGCWKPYTTSLDFTKLNISDIESVIEVNQVGINNDSKSKKKEKTELSFLVVERYYLCTSRTS